MSLNNGGINYKFIKDKKVSSGGVAFIHPNQHYSNYAAAGIMEDEVMAIIRAVKDSNYTVISNNILQNKGLSLEAKGLLCELLSYPENWIVHKTTLARSANGVRQINRIFKELKAAGHLEVIHKREDNKIKTNEWVVYESSAKKHENDIKTRQIVNDTKRDVHKTCTSQNALLQSNNILQSNNNIKNTHTMVDDEILKVEKKKAKQFGIQQELFEEFWSHRPGRGKGSNSKALALKQWNRRMREGVDPYKLINALKFYKMCCQQDGIINTRTTMQVSTFLGEGEHYETDWEWKATIEVGKKVKTPEDLEAEKDREEEIEQQHEAAYLKMMKDYNKTHPLGVRAEA